MTPIVQEISPEIPAVKKKFSPTDVMDNALFARLSDDSVRSELKVVKKIEESL